MLSFLDFRERWVVRIWNNSTIFGGAYNMTHFKALFASDDGDFDVDRKKNNERKMVVAWCVSSRKPQNMPDYAVVCNVLVRNTYEFQVQYQVYHRIIGYVCLSLSLTRAIFLVTLRPNTHKVSITRIKLHPIPISMHKTQDAQCEIASVACRVLHIGQFFYDYNSHSHAHATPGSERAQSAKFISAPNRYDTFSFRLLAYSCHCLSATN